jgi:hypothetical protein
MATPQVKKTSAPASTTTNGSTAIPKFNDPRLEFFYLLGILEGDGARNYRRISELAIQIADNAPTAEGTE